MAGDGQGAETDSKLRFNCGENVLCSIALEPALTHLDSCWLALEKWLADW